MTNKVRYVGRAAYPKSRLVEHTNDGLNNLAWRNPKQQWLKELRDKGLKPIMEVIEVCAWHLGDEREKAMIKHYKDNGYDLLNAMNMKDK